MVDSALFPAIRQAIRQNELGSASPYCLSYARRGNSGASFGIFQGDTNVNPLARQTLSSILTAASVANATAILAAVSQPLPNGNPLNPADTAAVNAALDAATGRSAVDAMDTTLMQTVLAGIDTCTAVDPNRPIVPEAQLYIALWVNMTGAPTSLKTWLGGTAVTGVAPPTGAAVAVAEITAYLKAAKYFQENPGNFAHLQASVTSGAALLPAS